MNAKNVTYEDLKHIFKQMHKTNIEMGLSNALANLKAFECLWNMCETLEIEPLLLDRDDDSLYVREVINHEIS